MLCDEIIANGVPGSGCNISRMLPLIQTAQKFILSPEFASVADALSCDYTGLVRAFPHCRLPFAKTWIELAHLERPSFAAAPMKVPRFQMKPKRVGYLLTATRPDLSAWKAHLFWSAEQSTSCPGALAMEFDMTSTFKLPQWPETKMTRSHERSLIAGCIGEKNHPGWEHATESVRQAMADHTRPTMPDYEMPMPIGIPPNRYMEFYTTICNLSRHDWAGEPAYLLAVIGLLNARNAVETDTVDYCKLNRARMKRGKPPLYEHKLLKIAHRQHRRVYANGDGGDYTPMRQHFCRGHFKIRRTGVFFWHPHLRGDPARGRIEKDYELR
jgi:hypothetical protein